MLSHIEIEILRILGSVKQPMTVKRMQLSGAAASTAAKMQKLLEHTLVTVEETEEGTFYTITERGYGIVKQYASQSRKFK